MKKIFALIFVAAMFAACSGTSSKEDQNDSTAVDTTIVDSTVVATVDSAQFDTVSEKK